MEGYNNQGENSSRHVQQLNPHDAYHSDSETRHHTNNSGGAADGGARPYPKRRGRPPGSKNKPKTPIFVTRDNPNVPRSHVLNFSAGVDIMESLNKYARQRGIAIFVLNGSGTISNVTIRQPSSSSESVVTLIGAFEIVSVTGMVLPPLAPQGTGGLSILLSAGHGELFGGNVVGPLIGTCMLGSMLTSFSNVLFESLPLEEEEAAAQDDTGSGASKGQQVQSRSLNVDPAN